MKKNEPVIAEELLVGAWDLHMHAGPDVVPRVQTADAVLADARAAGMAAIGLKDHCGSTAALASVLNVRGPAGSTRVFGSVTLNPPVGGFNPAAVEAALRLGARTVWFPTYSAQHHLAVLGKSHFPMGNFSEGLALCDVAGALCEGVAEILKLVAEHDAVLATGHLAPEESLKLFRAAKSFGLRRLVLTHATLNVTAAGLEVQREAVSLGAMVEHCILALTPVARSCSPEEMVEQIRALGPQHVFLTSDLGQVENGPIVASFGQWLSRLVEAGLAPQIVRQLVTENPERLMEG